MLLAAGLVAGLAVSVYTRYFHAGQRRPDFTLNDLHGRPRSPADFNGKVLLINFWATWCQPCRTEIPMLIKAQKAYRRRGLQIIGIAVDKPGAVRRFAHRYQINYPVLANPIEGARIQDAYSAGGSAPRGVLPYTAVVDRKGQIVARVAGALTRARLDRLVEPLIGRNRR